MIVKQEFGTGMKRERVTSMKKITAAIYAGMPVLVYFLLLWRACYVGREQTTYQIQYGSLLLFVLLGAVLAVGVFASKEMEVKACRLIACFWIILLPVIYILIFTGIAAFSAAMEPFAKMEHFLILEGIYITVLLYTLVKRNR